MAWCSPPTPPSAEVKERVELYFYSPIGFRGLFYSELYLYLKYKNFTVIENVTNNTYFDFQKTRPSNQPTITVLVLCKKMLDTLVLCGPVSGTTSTAELARLSVKLKTKLNSVALVRERTIPTERPPPVGEVSANFCG